jgi:uncharacterized protein YcbK (DUF882 family)
MNFLNDDTLLGSEKGITRRGLLTLGLLTAAVSCIPYKASASVREFPSSERALSFYNTHTGESMKSVYWSHGEYIPTALNGINNILRDHRTGDVKKIDTDLLNILFALQKRLGSSNPFHIISGYRSPKTNSLLRTKSKGVVKNSLHLYGKAVDIRLPGYDLKALQRTAIELKGGGVGYYSRLNFIHVDVGRVRNW